MTHWTSRHLHLATGATSALDRVLAEVAAPAARDTGRPWFFVRYWQGGPHLRLRVADLDGPAADRLTARLERLLEPHLAPRAGEPPVEEAAYTAEASRHARGETGENRTVSALRPAGAHPATYEPELERYGGADVMAASERLFVRSSELVVDVLPSVPTLADRRRLALRLAAAAARPLGPLPAQSVFFEVGRRSWAAWARSYGTDEAVVTATARVDRAPAPGAFEPLPGVLGTWHDDVAVLVATLGHAGHPVPGAVVSSHVHMTHNRLGLGILDELRTYAVLARTFPADPAAVPDLGLPVPA
ncbi:thiopeptide-type bacteriocin biosynthesis protein [Phycicoccus sp. BSK3Z-2]|uniref:Thiopeptide-type bacteriocin biosynthesis protein n=1 Tax=Phycicoccus avicenniae TaxID=2828860 RepID=A0A941D6F5_9MICO|nr:thiopeptide-type bacteriocin biosynthesis protein [Phycicoccus avicenniae]MBR7742528.1 thiopeptide-type bacteriocin biosynthesis protein [Phycicoccus avicenniae]